MPACFTLKSPGSESDAWKSLDQMKIFMELRGLQPNTVYTFALCARRFLAHAGKMPTDIKAADVESFLLDLTRKGRSPQTRNVNLSAVRCLLFATLGDDSRVNSSSYQGDWLKHYALEAAEGPVGRRRSSGTAARHCLLHAADGGHVGAQVHGQIHDIASTDREGRS